MNPTAQFFDGISSDPKRVTIRRSSSTIDILQNGNERIYSFSARKIDLTKSSFLKNEIRIILNDQPEKMLWIRDSENERLILNFLKDSGITVKKQRTGIVTAFSIVLAVILLIGAALYFSVPLISEKIAGSISFDYEKQIGDQILTELISKEGSLVTSPEIDSLHSMLLQKIDHDNFPVTIYIIESETVNAMALPGGHVVVYTGMLKKLNSAESYYALLGHEIGHVVKRHVVRGLVEKSLIYITTGLILGDASVLIGNIAADLTSLSYTRDAERESDEFAVDQLKRENISAQGMVDLFKALKELGDQPKSLEFMSSHPVTDSRLQLAEDFQKTQSSAELLDPIIRDGFSNLKRSVK